MSSRSTSCQACVERIHASLWSATTRRRCTRFAPRSRDTSSSSTGVSGIDDGDPGNELPLEPADPRRRQRRRRRRHRRVFGGAAGGAHGAGARARNSCAARTRTRRPTRCATASWRIAKPALPLHEQAVLVRASHHSALLELELGVRRIPFVKYGGLRFIEAAHVKDMLAAFRLADNPERRRRMVPAAANARRRGTGHRASSGGGARAARLGGRAADDVTSWPRGRQRPSNCPTPARAGGSRARRRRSSLHPGESIATHAERLRVAVAPLVEAAYPEAPARLADLDTLVAASSQVARLSDVAADHVLEPPRSTGNLAGPPVIDEDWLVISTVHSAKGLEWDVVHLLHVTDGNIPSDMALGSPDGLEEERRVFYVALTRARNALHLYVPERYHHHPIRARRSAWLGTAVALPVRAVRSRCEQVTERNHRPDSIGCRCHRSMRASGSMWRSKGSGSRRQHAAPDPAYADRTMSDQTAGSQAGRRSNHGAGSGG